MKYDAITIDTQTVERNGFSFDAGLLAQLKQFKISSTSIIISNIVASEILKHLFEKTKSARDSLNSAHKKASEHGLLLDGASPGFNDESDFKVIARKRLARFLSEIGAELIKYDDVSVSDLTKLYFSGSPPFSAGKKKSEFPDAIALLSLERWAEQNNKQILAVSNDNDWQTYAEKSKRIDVVSELADALTDLQKHADKAREIAKRIFLNLETKVPSAMYEDFYNQFSEAVADHWVSGEAESLHHVDTEHVELRLKKILLPEFPDEIVFSIVQYGDSKVVAKVSTSILVGANASFSMSHYDSVDGDYVPMGSTDAYTEAVLESEILITIEGDFDDFDTVDIMGVDLLELTDTIDFGYIELDFGEEYYG